MIKFYPYELHTHTLHSDGMFTPETLAKAAKADGLSGFALTDHNTLSGNVAAVKAGKDLGLTVIPGTEWTTFYGHITVLGGSFKEKWDTVTPQTILEKVKSERECGALVGIAHPFRIGYPICTGGSDEWGLNDYEGFTHYEVWSYLSPAKNYTNSLGEKRYLDLCARGIRLAAVYGRDWHGFSGDGGAHAATYLGIEGSESAAAAMKAIELRHTYISTGITLDARLMGNNAVYNIGDIVPAGRYKIECRADESSLEYSQKFGVKIGGISLAGTALSGDIFIECGEYAREINLNAGYLQVAVYGEIEGEKQKLAIATPFFIE